MLKRRKNILVLLAFLISSQLFAADTNLPTISSEEAQAQKQRPSAATTRSHHTQSFLVERGLKNCSYVLNPLAGTLPPTRAETESDVAARTSFLDKIKNVIPGVKTVTQTNQGGESIVYKITFENGSPDKALKLSITPNNKRIEKSYLDEMKMFSIIKEQDLEASLYIAQPQQIINIPGRGNGLLSDFIPMGDLNQTIEEYKYPKNQTEKDRAVHARLNLEAWRQIAVGIRGLHHNGFIHRDINPKNILKAKSSPTSTPVLKITDFGITHNGPENFRSLEQIAGTLSHMPPEQLKKGAPGSKMNDLYAMRVTFTEMLMGQSIWKWKVRDREVLIQEEFHNQGTYPVLLGIPKELRDNCHPSLLRVLELQYKTASIDDFIKVIDEEIYRLWKEDPTL